MLPDMLGADGPRNYFMVFQNNAEIRATGGIGGAWALLHVDDGRLELRQQGSTTDFPPRRSSVTDLTDAEMSLIGPKMGTYFQNAGSIPDFPRAAEIFRAWWQELHPRRPSTGSSPWTPSPCPTCSAALVRCRWVS